MQKLGVFLAVMTIVATAHALPAAAEREHELRAESRAQSLDDPNSLASPNYRGYRPAWANPYAEPDELGVNDDPTPFDPADVDSGPSPLEPDAF